MGATMWSCSNGSPTGQRQAVVAAQDEARALGHVSIGTEHLLLGLLAGDTGAVARAALTHLGVSLDRSRREVVELLGRGNASPSGHIPFTPRSKKVLELSLREALTLGHNYIGTEHILLGIVREGEGVAMQVLTAQGATGDRVRAEALAQLGRLTTGRSVGTSAPDTTPGAERAIAAARELAAGGPMGTQHLLEALAMSAGSVAANVIAELGLDADDLAARIDVAEVDGTSDVTPELVAVRRMELHLDDDAVRIVLGDDTVRELVARLVGSMGNPIRGADGDADSLIGLWRSTVTSLLAIAGRLAPADDEEELGAGRTAAVRAAIRSRLRRRAG